MEERITMIDSFKSPAKNGNQLGFLVFLDTVILLLTLLAVTAAACSPFMKGLNWTWDGYGMSLFVLLSAPGLFSWSSNYVVWRLLKHRAILLESRQKFDLTTENTWLSGWMNKNQPSSGNLWRRILELGISLIIMGIALWQMLPDSNNFIWPYLQWPFSIAILLVFLYNLRRLMILRRHLLPIETQINDRF